MSTGAYLSLLQFLHEMPYMSFSIAIWSQNLGTGTIFEPNLPFKTGCNKFQMESVKKKKEAISNLF